MIGKIESKADGEKVVNDSKFALVDFKEEEENWTADGWTRYYIVIITGDSPETVRVALFNGSIDGSTTQKGTVCYDYVQLLTLGTYTIDTVEYEDDDEDKPASDRERIMFSAANGYTVFDELTPEELSELSNKETYTNIYVHQPTQTEWDEMIAKALEKPEESDPGTDETGPNVNWALLTSVISSVALVGSLLIVVVIRQFKKRNSQI